MNWNTDWDPYQTLMNCQYNIKQCVTAINNTSDLMQEVVGKHNYQQNQIRQLSIENHRLRDQIRIILNELADIKSTIDNNKEF